MLLLFFVVVVNFWYPSISYYLLISFCFYCNLGAVWPVVQSLCRRIETYVCQLVSVSGRNTSACRPRTSWLLCTGEKTKKTSTVISVLEHIGQNKPRLTRIVKLAAVVGRREECHELTLGEEFVPIFDHLVGSAYQIKVMFG